MASVKYTPSEIEPKWQAYWAEHKTFKTGNPGDPGFDISKPKYYVLDMFPYPSGSGLHVGHPEGYTATDILARYKRANGFNVLHPMGWDAYGLPAEQYAVQTGTHPAVTTQKNIANFRATLQRLGFSYDWDREVDTTDPNYYKWTQWIFLKLYNSIFDPRINKARGVDEIVAELNANLIGVKDEKTLMFFLTGEQAQEAGLGKQWPELSADARHKLLSHYRLAYVDKVPVWWCEELGTVLANEEVIDGRSERGDFPCVKKPLRQWMMRITAYAERLIDDLESLDWPESIKLQQRNWIGRSEGAEVDFEIVVQASSLHGAGDIVVQASSLHGAGDIVVRASSLHGAGDIVVQASSLHGTGDIVVRASSLHGAGDIVVRASSLHGTAHSPEYQEITEQIEPPLALGSCVLKRPEIAKIVQDALLFFEGQRYNLSAWCVMPNHVHVVVTPLSNHTLPEILHSWKSFTASQINKSMGTSGTLWERESFNHAIRSAEDWEIFIRYTEDNPVEAGLSSTPESWAFSNQGSKFVRSPNIEFVDPRKQTFAPLQSRGELPHLLKSGVTYFVTFRLYDAVVPKNTTVQSKEDAGWKPAPQKKTLRVFTTRPDTLYGATYMVIAPEHPLVKELTTPEQKDAVEKYVREASGKSDMDRGLAKDKTGVFSGSYAFNPVFEDRTDPRAKIPIWIADYVLMGYGTGAIMAVPAHDERDAEFAVKFGLPIKVVVMPPDKWLNENSPFRPELAGSLEPEYRKQPRIFKSFFVDDGIAFNSPLIDGLPTPDAKKKIIAWLEAKKLGVGKVTYRLRDWLFSRQRYWGEPFPILWDDAKGHAYPLSEDSLPLTLPEMIDFKPTKIVSADGEPVPPLGKAKEWVNVSAEILPDGSARVVTDAGKDARTTIKMRRETNTMPQWAGSCWYYLRYMDTQNSVAAFAPDVEKYWMNVDLYVGGAEHAVLHLLYSRFWHKVLFDRGVVKDSEPFKRLFNQGLITAFSYIDDTGRKIPSDEIEEKSDGTFAIKATGVPVKQIVAKMSKTLKNVVNPNDVIDEFGSDTLRLYEMFMGPLDGSKPWNPRDVPGMFRFLRDCWRMIVEDDEREPKAGNLRMNLLPSASELIGAGAPGDALERELHKTIKDVTQDIDRMAFNTAISKLMVFKNNALKDITQLTRSQAKRFLILLSPFAPHIAEELWSRMRFGQSVALEAWPKFDEALTRDATKELAIQVNGKIKGRIVVSSDATDEAIKAAAMEAIKADLAGKTIAKIVVVPGRLVNIVIK